MRRSHGERWRDFDSQVADNTVTLTQNTLSGLAPATITYAATGGLFGQGIAIWAGTAGDSITIASARVDDVTTLYANAGDDAVTVQDFGPGSSPRLLVLHGDAGDDTIDASAVTGGNLTTLIFGDSGAETFAGPVKSFATLTLAQSIQIDVGGDDKLYSGTGPAILFGGFGADLLVGNVDADILLGDNGVATYAAGVLTQVKTSDDESVLPGTAGVDTILTGGGTKPNIVLGGLFGDFVNALPTDTTSDGDDIVLGDNGIVHWDANGVLIGFASTEPDQGGRVPFHGLQALPATVSGNAWGSASPTSSLARITSRRAIKRGSSPPASILASQYIAASGSLPRQLLMKAEIVS